MLAAGMNPVDVRIATGTFPNERHEPPYVAGQGGRRPARRRQPRLLRRERRAVRRVRRAHADRGRQRLPASRTGSTRRWPSASASPGSRPGCRSSGAARCSRARRCWCSARAAWSARSRSRPRSCSAPGRVVAAARSADGAGARARARRRRDGAARRRRPRRRAARGGRRRRLRPRARPALGRAGRGGAARAASRSGGSCSLGQSAGAEATIPSAAVRAQARRHPRLHELHRRRGAQGRRLRALARHAAAGEHPRRASSASGSTTCPRPGGARRSPHRKLVVVP